MSGNKSTIGGGLWEGLSTFGEGIASFATNPQGVVEKLVKVEAPGVSLTDLEAAHKKLTAAQAATGNKDLLPSDQEVLSLAGYIHTQSPEGKAFSAQVLQREKTLLAEFNESKQAQEIYPQDKSNPLYLQIVEKIFDKAGISLLPPSEQIVHLQSSLNLSEKEAKELVVQWMNRHPSFESRKSLYYQIQAEEHRKDASLSFSLYEVALAYNPRSIETRFKVAHASIEIAKNNPDTLLNNKSALETAQPHIGELFQSREIAFMAKGLLLMRAGDRLQADDPQKTTRFLKNSHDLFGKAKERFQELKNSNSDQAKKEMRALIEIFSDLGDEIKSVSISSPEDHALHQALQGDLRDFYHSVVDFRSQDSHRPTEAAVFQFNKEEQNKAHQAYEARTNEFSHKQVEAQKKFDNGLKESQAKLEEALISSEKGRPVEEEIKTVVQLLQIDRQLSVKDYSAWERHIGQLSSLVSGVENLEKRGEYSNLLIRDLATLRDELRSSGNIDGVNQLLKQWTQDILDHLPASLLEKDGAKEEAQSMINRLVNGNDQRVIAQLNPSSLTEHLEKILASEKLFTEAKEIDTKTSSVSSEKKRNLLVASLASYPALGDKKKVEDRLTAIKELVAQSDDLEKLKTYAAVVPALKEVDGEIALEFKKKVSELAAKLEKPGAFIQAEFQLQHYREMKVVREAYVALGDSAGLERIKEDLDSVGKILELQLQDNKITRLDERLEAATALIEIDHLYFDIAGSTVSRVGKYFSDSYSDKAVREGFERSLKVHLPIWQQAMKATEDFQARHTTIDTSTGEKRLDDRAVLAHDLRIKESKTIFALLEHYKAFTVSRKEGGAPAIDPNELAVFANPVRESLRKELSIDLEKRVESKLEKFFKEQQIDGSEESQRLKQEVTAAVVSDFESLFHDQLESGLADQIPEAQFSELVEKAGAAETQMSLAALKEKQINQALLKSGSKKETKAFNKKQGEMRKEVSGRYLQAAAVFARIGLKQRAEVSMRPIIHEAESYPPLQRLGMLNKLVEIYQSSGMTEEANGILEKVVELDRPASGNPDIHEAAEIARASQYFNKGDLQTAHEILVRIPQSEVAQAIAEAIQKSGRTQRVMETIKILRTVSLQIIAAGKEEGKAHGINVDAIEHDTEAGWEEVKRLLLNGECSSVSEALKRIESQGTFKNFTTGVGSSGEQGFRASFDYNSGVASTIAEQAVYTFFQQADQIESNEKVFVGNALGLADKLIGESQSGIAMEIYSTFYDHPLADKDLQEQMVGKLRSHGFFEGAIEVAKNWSGIGRVMSLCLSSASAEEAKTAGIDLLTFGIGKKVSILAEGYHLVRAARAARMARFLNSSVGRHVGGWLAKSAGEATGFALVNMTIDSATHWKLDNWTVGNFVKETGSMFTMFGIMHAGGKVMNHLGKQASKVRVLRDSKAVAHEIGVHTLNKRAQKGFGALTHASNMVSMVASDYVNEAIGLKPPGEEWMSFTDRLFHAAVTDKKMGLTHKALAKIDKRSAKAQERMARINQRLDLREARAEARVRVGKALEGSKAFKPATMEGLKAAAHARAELEAKQVEAETIGRGEDPAQSKIDVQKRAQEIVKDQIDHLADTVAMIEGQQGKPVDLSPESFGKKLEEIGELTRKEFGQDPHTIEGQALVRELYTYSYARGNGAGKSLGSAELESKISHLQFAATSCLDRTGIRGTLTSDPSMIPFEKGVATSRALSQNLVRFALQSGLTAENLYERANAVNEEANKYLETAAAKIFGNPNSETAKNFRIDVAVNGLFTLSDPADLAQNFKVLADHAPRIAEVIDQINQLIQGERSIVAHGVVTNTLQTATSHAGVIRVPELLKAIESLSNQVTQDLVNTVEALATTDALRSNISQEALPLHVAQSRIPLLFMAIAKGLDPEAIRHLRNDISNGKKSLLYHEGQAIIVENSGNTQGESQGESQGFNSNSSSQEGKEQNSKSDSQTKQQETPDLPTTQAEIKKLTFGQSLRAVLGDFIEAVGGRNPFPEDSKIRIENLQALQAQDKKIGTKTGGTGPFMAALGPLSTVLTGSVPGTENTASKTQSPTQANIDPKFGKRTDAISLHLRNGNLTELLHTVESTNLELQNGAFQVGYWNGKPYITYVEAGQHYYVDPADNTASSLRPGLHPWEAEMEKMGSKTPQALQKRFQAPDGFFLVGFETNDKGLIVPMFAPTDQLTEYRHMTDYPGYEPPPSETAARLKAFMSGSLNRWRSSSPKRAYRVPLVFIPKTKVVKQAENTKSLLHPEIYQMIKSGQTLSTPYHLGTKDVQSSPYEALLIGDDRGEGRVGIIMKNGIPLLTTENGQEYFWEAKGIGLPEDIDLELVYTNRDGSGSAKQGRASLRQAGAEFGGYRRLIEALQPNELELKLMPRPVIAVGVEETVIQRDPKRLERGWDSYDKYDVSAQAGMVFRRAPSTRRLAYTSNPAYGEQDYYSTPSRLEKAQEHLGKVWADMFLSDDPVQYGTLHAQNLIHHPQHGVFTLTDFSDVDYYAKNFQLSVAGIYEYGIFSKNSRDTGATQRFLDTFVNRLREKGDSVLAEKFASLPNSVSFEDFIGLVEQAIIHPRYMQASINSKSPKGPYWKIINRFTTNFITNHFGERSPLDNRRGFDRLLDKVQQSVAFLEDVDTNMLHKAGVTEVEYRTKVDDLRQIARELGHYIDEIGRLPNDEERQNSLQWSFGTYPLIREEYRDRTKLQQKAFEFAARTAKRIDNIRVLFGFHPTNVEELIQEFKTQKRNLTPQVRDQLSNLTQKDHLTDNIIPSRPISNESPVPGTPVSSYVPSPSEKAAYETSLSQLEDPRSVLTAENKTAYRKVLQHALTGEIPQSQAKLELLEILRKNRIERLQSDKNVTITKIPLKEYIRSLQHAIHGGPVPPPAWLEKYAAEHPDIMVDRIDYKNPERKSKDNPDSLLLQLLVSENGLQLPQGALHSVDFYEDGSMSFKSAHLLPISLLLDAPSLIYGNNIVSSRMIPTLGSPEEVVRMHAEQARPNTISPLPNDIHTFKATDPFDVWLHDYNHELNLNRLSPELRQDLLSVYHFLKALPAEVQNQYQLSDEALTGRILEGVIGRPNIEGHQAIFLEIKEQIEASENSHSQQGNFSQDPSEKVLKREALLQSLYVQLQTQFPDNHPRRKEVLDAFNQEFKGFVNTSTSGIENTAQHSQTSPLQTPSPQKVLGTKLSEFLTDTSAQQALTSMAKQSEQEVFNALDSLVAKHVGSAYESRVWGESSGENLVNALASHHDDHSQTIESLKIVYGNVRIASKEQLNQLVGEVTKVYPSATVRMGAYNIATVQIPTSNGLTYSLKISPATRLVLGNVQETGIPARELLTLQEKNKGEVLFVETRYGHLVIRGVGQKGGNIESGDTLIAHTHPDALENAIYTMPSGMGSDLENVTNQGNKQAVVHDRGVTIFHPDSRIIEGNEKREAGRITVVNSLDVFVHREGKDVLIIPDPNGPHPDSLPITIIPDETLFTKEGRIIPTKTEEPNTPNRQITSDKNSHSTSDGLLGKIQKIANKIPVGSDPLGLLLGIIDAFKEGSTAKGSSKDHAPITPENAVVVQGDNYRGEVVFMPTDGRAILPREGERFVKVEKVIGPYSTAEGEYVQVAGIVQEKRGIIDTLFSSDVLSVIIPLEQARGMNIVDEQGHLRRDSTGAPTTKVLIIRNDRALAEKLQQAAENKLSSPPLAPMREPLGTVEPRKSPPEPVKITEPPTTQAEPLEPISALSGMIPSYQPVQLQEGGVYPIGRNQQNLLPIPYNKDGLHEAVSSNHGQFEVIGGKLYFTDRSRNGTMLPGPNWPTDPNDYHFLQNGRAEVVDRYVILGGTFAPKDSAKVAIIDTSRDFDFSKIHSPKKSGVASHSSIDRHPPHSSSGMAEVQRVPIDRIERISPTAPVLRKITLEATQSPVNFKGETWKLIGIGPSGKVLFRKTASPDFSGDPSNYIVISNDNDLVTKTVPKTKTSVPPKHYLVAEDPSLSATFNAEAENGGSSFKNPLGRLEIGSRRVVSAQMGFKNLSFSTNLQGQAIETEYVTRQGTKITIVSSESDNQNLPSASEITGLLEQLPEQLIGKAPLVIQLAPIPHPDYPGSQGEMNRDGTVLTYYPNSSRTFIADTIHELAHRFAVHHLGSSHLQSHFPEWIEAMQADEASVSEYAQKNPAEDFAETVTLYFMTQRGAHANQREKFARRFQILNELFKPQTASGTISFDPQSPKPGLQPGRVYAVGSKILSNNPHINLPPTLKGTNFKLPSGEALFTASSFGTPGNEQHVLIKASEQTSPDGKVWVRVTRNLQIGRQQVLASHLPRGIAIEFNDRIKNDEEGNRWVYLEPGEEVTVWKKAEEPNLKVGRSPSRIESLALQFNPEGDLTVNEQKRIGVSESSNARLGGNSQLGRSNARAGSAMATSQKTVDPISPTPSQRVNSSVGVGLAVLAIAMAEPIMTNVLEVYHRHGGNLRSMGAELIALAATGAIFTVKGNATLGAIYGGLKEVGSTAPSAITPSRPLFLSEVSSHSKGSGKDRVTIYDGRRLLESSPLESLPPGSVEIHDVSGRSTYEIRISENVIKELATQGIRVDQRIMVNRDKGILQLAGQEWQIETDSIGGGPRFRPLPSHPAPFISPATKPVQTQAPTPSVAPKTETSGTKTIDFLSNPEGVKIGAVTVSSRNTEAVLVTLSDKATALSSQGTRHLPGAQVLLRRGVDLTVTDETGRTTILKVVKIQGKDNVTLDVKEESPGFAPAQTPYQSGNRPRNRIDEMGHPAANRFEDDLGHTVNGKMARRGGSSPARGSKPMRSNGPGASGNLEATERVLNVVKEFKEAKAQRGTCLWTCVNLVREIYRKTGIKVKIYGAYSHSFIRMGNLIIDPTISQFFNLPEGEKPHVFVGTEEELKQELLRLAERGQNERGRSVSKIVKDEHGHEKSVLLEGKEFADYLYKKNWEGKNDFDTIPEVVRMLDTEPVIKEGGFLAWPLPPSVNPVNDASKAWAKQMTQVKVDELSHFPSEIRNNLQKIIEKSQETGHEYATLAFQVGDKVYNYKVGATGQTGVLTSKDARIVKADQWQKALNFILLNLRHLSPQLQNQPIKIYMLHTHPYRPSTEHKETPVYTHSDGQGYTYFSAEDHEGAEKLLQVATDYLRGVGYKGPVEIVAGAVPTGVESKNPYISIYTSKKTRDSQDLKTSRFESEANLMSIDPSQQTVDLNQPLQSKEPTDFQKQFPSDQFPGLYLHDDGTIVYRAFSGDLSQLANLDYKGIDDPNHNRLTAQARVDNLKKAYETEGPYSIAHEQRMGGRIPGEAERLSLSASVKISDTERYGENNLRNQTKPKVKLLAVTSYSKNEPLLHVTRLYRNHFNLPYGESYGDGEVGIISPTTQGQVTYYLAIRTSTKGESIYYEILNPSELQKSLLQLKNTIDQTSDKTQFIDENDLINQSAKELLAKGVLKEAPSLTKGGKIDFFAKKLEFTREAFVFTPSLKHKENSQDSYIQEDLIKIKEYLATLHSSDLNNPHIQQALKLLADDLNRLLSHLSDAPFPKTQSTGTEILQTIRTALTQAGNPLKTALALGTPGNRGQNSNIDQNQPMLRVTSRLPKDSHKMLDPKIQLLKDTLIKGNHTAANDNGTPLNLRELLASHLKDEKLTQEIAEFSERDPRFGNLIQVLLSSPAGQLGVQGQRVFFSSLLELCRDAKIESTDLARAMATSLMSDPLMSFMFFDLISFLKVHQNQTETEFQGIMLHVKVEQNVITDGINPLIKQNMSALRMDLLRLASRDFNKACLFVKKILAGDIGRLRNGLTNVLDFHSLLELHKELLNLLNDKPLQIVEIAVDSPLLGRISTDDHLTALTIGNTTYDLENGSYYVPTLLSTAKGQTVTITSKTPEGGIKTTTITNFTGHLGVRTGDFSDLH